MDACFSPAAAALGCALMFSLASCYVAKTIMHGRKHMDQTQLEMAKVAAQAEVDVTKIKAHVERLNRHLGSVLPAWPVLLLLMGGACSGGLLALSQRDPGEAMAAHGKHARPAPSPGPGPTPEPPRACNECPKCPCKGSVCNCSAESEKKPGIRADLMLPPGSSSAINPFGEPWAQMNGSFVSPRL